jgi:hypothetical protein
MGPTAARCEHNTIRFAVGADGTWHFSEPAAMGAAFASPEGQAVIADAANFLDMTRLQVMAVEEAEVPL